MSYENTTAFQRLFRWGIKIVAEILAILGYVVSWVMGRLQRPQTKLWHSNGGQNVLIIASHPDDETAGCAGTIYRHKQAGDHIIILFVTDGGKASSWLTPTELVQARHKEAEQASKTLQADQFIWLGLPELTWHIDELVTGLQKIWQTHSSNIIYTPSRIDFHPDHQRVAVALATTLATQTSSPLVRLYQAHVPLTPTLTNLVANVNKQQVEEVSALYSTQAWSVARTLRMKRYAGLYHGVGFGEVFWEMPASQFIQLHSQTNDFPKFRGLLYLPLTDPLAYLSGKKERALLKAGLD